MHTHMLSSVCPSCKENAALRTIYLFHEKSATFSNVAQRFATPYVQAFMTSIHGRQMNIRRV